MFLQSMLSSEHYIDEKVFYEAVRQYIVSLIIFFNPIMHDVHKMIKQTLKIL